MDTLASHNNWDTQHHGVFHSGYFDYRHAFRTVLDLYCCNGVDIEVKEL